MNNKRRASLKMAIKFLSDGINMLEKVRDDEEDALDNVPENLRESDRCQESEDIIDLLEDAISSVESGIEDISGIC